MNSTVSSRFGTLSMIVQLLVLLATGGLVGAGAASAENPENAKDFWEALTKGTPVLNMRGRIGIAETPALEQSQAYTWRTRLGYGTKPFYWTTAYMDFENVAGAATKNYWNLVEFSNGRTPIADPTATQVNQAYLKIANEDWADLKIIGGRQRIILDDARFVGNVAWRQNEQTFDGAYASSSLMLDDFQLKYGYLGKIRRVFGDQDYQILAPTYGFGFDWNSNTHLLNAGYTRFSLAQPAAFVYLVEVSNPRAAVGVQSGVRRQSSATYGFRVPGTWKFADDWSLAYLGSYAYQTDYRNNPQDYGAHYALVDAKLKWSRLGAVGGGYELLGSDDGVAQVKTPLATFHKFNGWADRFLDNGGPNGLQDLYVTAAPKLPWEIKMLLVYHHFWAHQGGQSLGNEFDARLSRSFTKHLELMFKSGYFKPNEGAAASVPELWRISMQMTLKL